MKLVTFELPGRTRRIGVLSDAGISDLTVTGANHFTDMLAMIDGGEEALQHADRLVTAPELLHRHEDVALLAPLPQPRQMRDFLCFEEHMRRGRANRHLVTDGPALKPEDIVIPEIWYDRPIYYKCNRFSVVGTGHNVVMPHGTRRFDYELEIGLVTSLTGKNISRAQASDHIFGYCIFNDFSARDIQMREMAGNLGPAKGKDFDTGNALGPWLVTADELNPYDLEMVARVNGEEWSRGRSETMHHRFEDILAHVSVDETIYPGEFFGSGTVGGGCGLELGRFLNAGDVVELEVSGLGILKNTVISNDKE